MNKGGKRNVFIQSIQLLGCACLIMLKKGKSKLQITDLLRDCSEVDDTSSNYNMLNVAQH